ncbi:MAG TPA: hypothetical protein VE986_11115 [Hyphomicrobiales bacterium]|nr:hypothetical protein [Hyphomicrobiales bacterium]
MGNSLETSPFSAFDLTPYLALYRESIEAWQKNLESFMQASWQQGEPYRAAPSAPAPARKPANEINAQAQTAGEAFMRRLVEEQLELFRFCGRTWEQYLSFWGSVLRSRSPAEVAQSQSMFLTQLASDYCAESTRLVQAFSDALHQGTAVLQEQRNLS